jgi:hypothetical protein
MTMGAITDNEQRVLRNLVFNRFHFLGFWKKEAPEYEVQKFFDDTAKIYNTPFLLQYLMWRLELHIPLMFVVHFTVQVERPSYRVMVAAIEKAGFVSCIDHRGKLLTATFYYIPGEWKNFCDVVEKTKKAPIKEVLLCVYGGTTCALIQGDNRQILQDDLKKVLKRKMPDMKQKRSDKTLDPKKVQDTMIHSLALRDFRKKNSECKRGTKKELLAYVKTIVENTPSTSTSSGTTIEELGVPE